MWSKKRQEGTPHEPVGQAGGNGSAHHKANANALEIGGRQVIAPQEGDDEAVVDGHLIRHHPCGSGAA